MRVAIVSDLHSNLQAWKAVLLDIRAMRTDLIFCLGDVVGYGPDPAEVVASVYEHANHCLLGNHDAALCGKIGLSTFTQTAADLIQWTRQRVGQSAIRFLSSLPLTVAAGGFRCAHGEFSQPGFFKYVFEPEDALGSWQAVPDPLLFVGHTHTPRIAVSGRSGKPHMIEPQDFTVEDDKRYLVNVGSVGQPRDGDPRASYCLYDADSRSVFWRRVPFDLDAYRAALSQAGVPEAASPFLRHDPLAGGRKPSDLAGFHPPSRPEDAVRGSVEVQTVSLLRRRARRWMAVSAGLAALLALALGASAWAWWRAASRSLVIEGAGMDSILALSAPPGEPLLRPPAETAGRLDGWTARLGDRYSQSISVANADAGEPVFRLRSGNPDREMWLCSRPVMVQPGMRMGFEALFRKSDDFSGSVGVRVLLAREGSHDCAESLAAKGPTVPRQNGWLLAKQSFELPARAREIRVEIGGRFSGSILVKDATLERRK